MSRLKLREPFSGLSHLFGAILSIAALVILCVQARGDVWKEVSFGVYGGSLILLYLASTVYHLLPVGPEWVERLRKLDQCAIYILIAGCYTPVCLIVMRGAWGWSLFGVAWGIAAAGIITQVVWSKMPCALHVVLYLAMGWLVVFVLHPVFQSLGSVAFTWLAIGGVIYTIGAVVFATERPRLWPGVFGFHDLWHVFVLAGSTCHFMMMLWILHHGLSA